MLAFNAHWKSFPINLFHVFQSLNIVWKVYSDFEQFYSISSIFGPLFSDETS